MVQDDQLLGISIAIAIDQEDCLAGIMSCLFTTLAKHFMLISRERQRYRLRMIRWENHVGPGPGPIPAIFRFLSLRFRRSLHALRLLWFAHP